MLRLGKLICEKSILYKAAEIIFLLFLGLYLAFLTKNASSYNFLLLDGTEQFLLTALRITVIIKLLFLFWIRRNDFKSDRKLLIKTLTLILFAECLRVVCNVVYHEDKYTFLLFMAVILVGTIGTDYRTIMKTFVVSVGLVRGSAILASLSGYINNYIHIRNGSIHSSWGSVWTTDYASIILYLCITAWIAWNRVSSKFFLFLGVLTILNAAFIAGSITSTVTGMCLLVFIILDGAIINKRRKLKRVLLELAFPFFAFLTFGMGYLYHRGTSIGIKLNSMFHGRLKLIDDGYRNYGLRPFGTAFSQVGNGGSTFVRQNYNFIDNTYVLILLRYGVILFVAVMILWVLATRKAVKLGHTRLAFGMALIALHSFSEHHFFEVNYNILIVLPFSVLGMNWLVKEEVFEVKPYAKRRFAAGTATAIFATILTLLGGPRLLSIFRTIFDMMDERSLEDKGIIICIAFMVITAFVVISIIVAYKLLCILIDWHSDTEASIKRRIITPAVVFGLMMIMALGGVIAGKHIINRKSSKYTECINVEETAIAAVSNGIKTGGGKFYVDEMPYIYVKRFGDISESFFCGDELAGRKKTTVLMDADCEADKLISMGFLYTEISDEHALYTNDSVVITELEDAGYHLTGYFSRKRIVDMEKQAELNELEMTTSGAINVMGPDKPIWRGPFFDLRSGVYSIIYDLSLPKVNSYKEDYMICTIKIMARHGVDTIIEVPVYRKDFDDYGNYVAKVKIDIDDCEACEFKLYVESGQSVFLNGMTCQKTPDIDVHKVVDRRGRVTRLSYYDLEGNKIETSDGYHAVEYKYDEKGNVSQYWYFDDKDDLAITRSGYAGLAREYDARKRIIKESYFGLKSENGTFYVTFEYDKNGNINEYRYYDSDDNLVMLTRGYAIMRRTFDEKSQKCVNESYYDTEDNPVLLAEGYASIIYSYDEEGREYNRRFCDEEGNLVTADCGYAERQLTYDASGKLIIEEYYNPDGSRATFDNGSSIIEYEYDLYGNRADTYYYDAYANPALYCGLYHHIHRVYNNKKQIIREAVYDMDNKPIVKEEGYVIYEREYDDNGNILVQRYYDANGKPVMLTGGYFEHLYYYDDNKRVIREEYYGTEGKPVNILAGYSSVEYIYDNEANQTDVLYYDVEGNSAMNWGMYYSIHRVFNDKKQIIREEYLDILRNSILRPDNYAAIERQYDEAGNMIEQTFLDLLNNLTLNSSGYAILCREYNSANRVTKEYYLDTYRQLVDCTSGYATIEYTYDDAGNLTNTVYYNVKGEVVEG